ncbi:MAG TPA: OmpA family protein [Vicinamibacterales bacterium]|jgi:outer membrane protein OmpA-like peptidoglycan-associated protein|nr:OmpA family protein [Vicinamibacterales bacterium]
MKKVVLAVPVLALALGGTTACATKKFVRGEVAQVNEKVDTLTRSVEETQERTRVNEQRIGEVDQKALAADQKAAQAGQRADEARSAAEAVNTRADAIEKTVKRLVYEVVLTEDKGGFKFGNAALPEQSVQEIDQLVQQLKANPNGSYIEIEGHTDATGPKDLNQRLGLLRAENVKRYLYETHQVPLHKINVISYGEEKPIAPNNTRDGRAQNRRVVIKVLS